MRMFDVKVASRLLELSMGAMRRVIVYAREHGEHDLADALTVARDAWARAAASWLARVEARVAAKEVA